MKKKKVLFLCTGNSARSQMAEALLRDMAGERFEVFSAGLEPKGVHPFTILVLRELDIKTGIMYSKNLDEFLERTDFAYLITVCSDAQENCPATVLAGAQRLHWGFEDPAVIKGSQEEALEKFREVRDLIKVRVEGWGE
ncbi:MAG: arsenate reductase ArsC [Chloroflexi bacterium]|nr:arsenate reductase ArsC [Chloroflexota bacterium]